MPTYTFTPIDYQTNFMNSSKSVFVGVFMLMSLGLRAQNQELKQWLEDTASTIDSVRWDALGNLGYYYLYRQEDSARYFLEKLSRESINDNRLLRDSYYWMAIYLEEVSDLDSANHFYRKALRLIEDEQNPDNYNFIKVYLALGSSHSGLSYDSGLFYYQKALSHAQAEGDSSLITKTLSGLAVLYGDYDQKEKSVEMRFEILKYAERVNDKDMICVQKLNIGSTLRNLKRYEEAYNYLEEGTRLAEEIDRVHYAAYGHNVLGSMYNNEGKYDLAKLHYKKSLQMRLLLGNPVRTWETRAALMSLHVKEKDWERARIMAEENVETLSALMELSKFNYYKCFTYLGLAKTYVGLDQLERALNYLNIAEQVSLDNISRSDEHDLTWWFHSCYKALNRYEDAYEALSRWKELDDSIR
ncbi:MAG: tetratricopeptide repeat protein, partial [Bacteroidota bacterium]